MKNQILYILFFVPVLLSAQVKIAVNRQGSTYFYNNLDTALFYANDTSTIYLPGGIYPVSNLQIKKSVKLIGAGYWPDSTMATQKSTIAGNVFIMKGADSGFISGVEIKGDVYFGTAFNDGASDYAITRSSMYNLTTGYTTRGDLMKTNCQNIYISECLINKDIYGNFATNILFLKNLITGSVSFYNGYLTLKNNIFLFEGNSYSAWLFNTLSGAEFSNNVILKNLSCTYCTLFINSSDNNNFSNNIFYANVTFPTGTNTGAGNVVNKAYSDIFVLYGTHPFNSNYKLKSGSGGIGAGTDGYDIGIYGSPKPWKEGAVPSNPHIQRKEIASETDGTGKLKVKIQVQAQQR